MRQAGEEAGDPRCRDAGDRSGVWPRPSGGERARPSRKRATGTPPGWWSFVEQTAWLPGGAHANWSPRALRRLDRERANLRAALAWSIASGDAGTALRLTSGVAEYWLLRGDFTEGRDWLSQALDLEGGAPQLRAAALYGASGLAENQGDRVAALALAAESLALASRHGDQLDVLRARLQLARPTNSLGDATPHLDEALALARQLGDRRWLGYATIGKGFEAYRRGDHARAADVYDEAIQLFAGVDDRYGEMNATFALAVAVHALGDRARAVELYLRTIDLGRGIAGPWGILRGITGLAAIGATVGNAGNAGTVAHCSAPWTPSASRWASSTTPRARHTARTR